MEYKATIGLEIHAELKTKSKMFCGCKNNPLEKEANTNICPVCMAHPGTLPVINEDAVKKVIKTGLALKCKVASKSGFERKNYFYPDLPKGYQISQYALPLCRNGFLQIGNKKITIERIHLEEDTARLIHEKDASLLDFNRAGVPLMELVTDPDLSSGEEAQKFAQQLQLIFRYLGVSDADMEKGQMRIEANISISTSKKLGTKVEVKNLNSFKIVKKAIEYEIKRQAEVLDKGEKIAQETRGWDEKKQITLSQRTKEESHDYRYFPEPDLPALSFKEKYIQDIRSEIPELPENRRIRLKDEYELKESDVEIFVSNKDLGEYLEQVVSEFHEWFKSKDDRNIGEKEYKELAQIASNYILSELLGLLGGMSVENKRFFITPENFAEFVFLFYKKSITSKISKIVLKEMFKNGSDPSSIIDKMGLVTIDDKDKLGKIIEEVMSENLKAVKDFKDGEKGAFQFLLGQAMSKTKGKASPEILKQLFTKALK
ncbi:MAG: Asp-tRNA(Asn)/Glu-tRNA(Gln) amidotransferase subunit GatB [Patescibacteria group bacterium]|nr:Asp-tRNA(Asn)/Glu-tRNA(Gln) amidotransferase subunit GatB [Patescibacteria group bacterium]